MLRATQYLPDIVKLQLFLYDMYNYRMDRSDAIELTIHKFLQQLENGKVSLNLIYIFLHFFLFHRLFTAKLHTLDYKFRKGVEFSWSKSNETWYE